MNTEDAKTTLASLEAKRKAALAGLAKAEDRRAALSYDAMVGSKSAAKDLAAANSDKAAMQGLIADLNLAIVAAKSRLDEAVKEAASDDLRRRAEAAAPIADAIASTAIELDEALASAIELKRKFETLIARAREIGAPIAAADLVAVNMRRAADTWILQFHPMAARAVSIGDRRDFSYFGNSWAAMASKWSQHVLAQGSPPAADEPADDVMTPQPSKAARAPSMATAAA